MCDRLLQGASNLWFPVLISALSVPQAADDLGRLVEENWAVLDKATSLDVLKAFRQIGQLKDLSQVHGRPDLGRRSRRRTKAPAKRPKSPTT